MSITVELDLPEALAERTRAKGLLDPNKVRGMIQRELDLDEPLEEFRRMVEAMRSHRDDEPMTLDEIQAEVEAVRAKRRPYPLGIRLRSPLASRARTR